MRESDKEIAQLVREGKKCPYCWGETDYRDSLYVPFLNKVDKGFVFVCENCNAYATETSPKSGVSDGRIYNPKDRIIMEEVLELWMALPRYRTTKYYFMKRKYGPILGVYEPENMMVQNLTVSQLKKLKKLLKGDIAMCIANGKEYHKKGVRKFRKTLLPGYIPGNNF